MVSTVLQGRLGNQLYQIGHLLSYCKEHGLEYYIPNIGHHCDGTKMYFPHLAMGPELHHLKEIHEQSIHATRNSDGTYDYKIPIFKEFPKQDNIKFVGYWQTFKYLDPHRDYLLNSFNLPYSRQEKKIAIHCRFGDFLQLRDKHPEVPADYYIAATNYFKNLGYNDFIVFSDNQQLAKELLKDIDANIEYTISSPGQNTELEEFIAASNCDHQILCYSTFGWMFAWMCQNPNKITIIPPRKYCFSGAHKDFIPDYYTELNF